MAIKCQVFSGVKKCEKEFFDTGRQLVRGGWRWLGTSGAEDFRVNAMFSDTQTNQAFRNT